LCALCHIVWWWTKGKEWWGEVWRRGGGGGEKRDEFRILVRKPEGRDHLEDPGIILIY